MMDFLPDMDAIIMWLAGGGGGWLVHKRVSIDYKERWKSAVNLLKEEKLQTEELMDTLPKPKEKPTNFAPAGDPAEFENMTNVDRYKSEVARLQNGLPPKDAMLGLHNYSSICIERVKCGWDWDHELNGWGWRPTKSHQQMEAEQKRKIKKAYDDGYNEGYKRMIPNASYTAYDMYDKWRSRHGYDRRIR